MRFAERSYVGSNSHWPKPEIFYDEHEKFLSIITPWGARGKTNKISQTIVDYFVSSKTDHEVTMPFARLTNISSTANNLRIAVLLANELIYNEENREEYTFGVEVLLASFEQRELTWVNVGGPHIILSRPGTNPVPAAMNLNLSSEASQGNDLLPPLPKNILGLDPAPHISVGSIKPKEHDKIFLINHSWLPSKIMTLTDDERTLESVSKVLAEFHDSPFWVGELTLD